MCADQFSGRAYRKCYLSPGLQSPLVAGSEMARLDLEGIVPVAGLEPGDQVARDGQMAGGPLFQDVEILVQHQLGVGKELLGATSKVDAPSPRARAGVAMQAVDPRVLDDAYVRDAAAEDLDELRLEIGG